MRTKNIVVVSILSLAALAGAVFVSFRHKENVPIPEALRVVDAPDSNAAKARHDGPKDSETPPPVLVLDDGTDLENALQSLIVAVEAKDVKAALGIARSIRNSGNAAKTIAAKLLRGNAINPEAFSTRSRITALCLAGNDSQLDELLRTLLAGWIKEKMTASNKASWEGVEKKPVTVLAAEALNEPDRSGMNGLLKAMLWRLQDAGGSEAKPAWGRIWAALRADATMSDPLISLALWHWVQDSRGSEVAAGWKPYFAEIRSDLKLSLRLRVQAATAIAPVSQSVLDFLANLAKSLNRKDAAKVFGNFLSTSPQLTADDWALILSALLNGRGLGDGASILREACMAAGSAICNSGRIEDYGDALVGLFTATSGDESLTSLAGDALYSLIVGRQMARGLAKATGPRQVIFKNVRDEEVLAQLLATLETELFRNPSSEPKFMEKRIAQETRVVRLLFELRLSTATKLDATETVLKKCASKRERLFSAQEALAGLGGLNDNDIIQGGQILLTQVVALADGVLFNDESSSPWATLSSCTNPMKVALRVAKLQVFPPLTNEQLEVLHRIHDTFSGTVKTLRVGADDRTLKKLDQYASEFQNVEAALGAAYKMPWVESPEGGKEK